MRVDELESAELLARLEALLRADEAGREVLGDRRRPAGVAEAGGGRFAYAYDERGDLSASTSPDGQTTRYDYDERRRLVAVVHPDGQLTGYRYTDDDRLAAVTDRGVEHRFQYDRDGRLATVHNGRSDGCAYRYTATGELAEARSAAVTTRYTHGDVRTVTQTCDGVTIEARLEYDANGRLLALRGPDGVGLRYEWDADGRFRSVSAAGRTLAAVEHRDNGVLVRLANGVSETRDIDPVDGRPLAATLHGADGPLLYRRYDYRDDGRLAGDGDRRFHYDELGRLAGADEADRAWRYAHEATGGRAADEREELVEDANGRLIARWGRDGEWTYTYDDAGRLLEARRDGAVVAMLAYDHAGRLVKAAVGDRVERYLHSMDGTLLAVTDAAGAPLRIPVGTPLGVLAELTPAGVRYPHADHLGTVRLVTGEDGAVLARPACGPYGEPVDGADRPEVFCGKVFHPELGLYDFGSRWYDPRLGRFLTRDSHTNGPDDARLVHPFGTGARQVAERDEWLPVWLARPRLGDRHAFCAGDPVNRFDPDGHWSFGWLLLSMLGAIWTLPNTLIGLLIEVTCVISEPIRWIVAAIGGTGRWQPVGFDAAASGQLDAFGLVFVGGWMGSLGDGAGRFQAITFGNVFFLNRNHTATATRIYEHELRHTNQYGWFGPLYLLVYLIDTIAHGYGGSKLEGDARKHEVP